MRNVVKVILVLMTTWFVYENDGFMVERIHGKVEVRTNTFTESNQELINPNRGFYIMYGFIIADETKWVVQTIETMDRLYTDDRMLAMIQINLCNYTDRPISELGLKYIESLFQEFRTLKKQYLFRFLYDWDGKNAETEPQDVEIILEHMRQLKDIFHEYSDIIFTHQGLFIGNWGEMNGTKHYGEIPRLALQLAAVTDEKTYLAVRMPAQWRIATGLEEITEEGWYRSSLAHRLGLYNDGIMGNIGDYGTYGNWSKEDVGIYNPWNRVEELNFQEKLCELVPNGGEVIVDNPINDFENAIRDLAKMHLTYLNIDFDKNVLNKWKKSEYNGEGCFDGMDGLSYVERHLGYRLLIAENSMDYDIWKDSLLLNVSIKNVGFAPLYREPEVYLTVQKKETGDIRRYLLETELCSLAGGNESENRYVLTEDISLTEFVPGEYEIFLSLRDKDSNYIIQLANEQELQEYGYLLGVIRLDVKSHSKLRR